VSTHDCISVISNLLGQGTHVKEEEKGKGLVAAAASLGSDVSRSRVTGFYPDNNKRWPVYCYYLILLLCSFIFFRDFFFVFCWAHFVAFKL